MVFGDPSKYQFFLEDSRNTDGAASAIVEAFGGDVVGGSCWRENEDNGFLVLVNNEAAMFAKRFVGQSYWYFEFAGPDYDTVTKWRDKINEALPEIEPAADDEIIIGFWALDGDGSPCKNQRRITGYDWTDIAGNYPTSVRAKLDELMDLDPSTVESGGKLVLWHGPPGTGKTHCIRSLGIKWRDWCSIDYVVDPERYFGAAYYMLSTFANDEPDKWKLLIIEDAGEFLRTDAKAQTGQGLSRLLNLTDGLLGQGMKLLVLMTTNEPMEELHPAVHRPGRCLATISFDKFNRSEAQRWVKSHDIKDEMVTSELTLAELYERYGTLRIAKELPGYNPAGYA